MTFTPSPEQLAFRDALLERSSSIILEAVAGSGKTTTIVWSTGFIPAYYTVRFLAFNKNIQRELASRLPPHVQCSTFHSVGFGALRSLRKFGSPEPDKSKLILKKKLSDWEFGQLVAPVCRLVGHAKNAGLGTDLMEDSEASWRSLAAHHNIDFGDADEDRVYDVARKLLTESSNRDTPVIDFDDMLYLPLRHGLPFERTNFVFIDEAQDTNAVQRALLHRMLHPSPNGRLIAVGDPMQAIYGFRGADADALERLREEFEAETLPLSVSYRCSQAVVKEAQKFYAKIN